VRKTAGIMELSTASCRSQAAVPPSSNSRSGAKPKSAVEPLRDDPQTRKAAAACDGILRDIPTIFGKLVTLAGMRTNGAGQYNHPQLDEAFPRAVTSSLFRQRHEDTFSQWLNLSLEEQHKQLTEFFCAMWTVGRPRLPENVRQALAPPAAAEPERILFLSDLECTISVIEAEHA
jgi:hypothetical protein